MLLVSWASAAHAEGGWGVKVTFDVPLTSAPAFVANPFGYAASHHDVLDVRGYLEWERFGLEARYRSATEAYVGGYYIIGLGGLFGHYAESTVGVYLGRSFAESSTFVALRGALLLYGSF